jgi:carbonic anhydrase/acetyltransferase-like protein (isoleucine patch superfamily)
MNRWALLVSALALILPAALRRVLLNTLCGYAIERGASVGCSLIGVPSLKLGAGARIGHFNVIKGIPVELGEQARIGDFNWISGLPRGTARHFREEADRDPRFVLGRHASLTARHYVDCSNRVEIGEFSTVAGAHTQILTHAIDLQRNRQVSKPALIGRYCFVGTACVVLKGARLPDCSVLAAHSSLAHAFEESYTLYSGVPAAAVKALARDAAYFHRDRGFVD